MSGIIHNILFLGGTALLTFCCHGAANAQTPALPVASAQDDAEYTKDVAALTDLNSGGRRTGKPSLRQMLRHPGREWPRLMIRYAQPMVRGLLLDTHSHGGSLALQTTFFNNTRGMKMVGGIGRDVAGDREARVRFSVRF